MVISCTAHRYSQKSKKNIKDFGLAIDHIMENALLAPADSLVLRDGLVIKYDHKCLYRQSTDDSLLIGLIKKFDLKRICFWRYDDGSNDSAITFHRDYNPFFGKAVVVVYDFGKSELRDKVKAGIKKEDEKIVIINDLFLYVIKSRPAFGE